MNIPDSFYRVSIKALVIKDDKILLCQEDNNQWELPGGGLDFGESFHDCLRREIKEEMGLEIKSIANKPTYVWTQEVDWKGEDNHHRLILAYRTELKSLDFTPSSECATIQFFSQEELQTLDLHPAAKDFRDIFNPQDFR